MNETTKIFIQIGVSLVILYLYKQFLENMEGQMTEQFKRQNDMMLDFFNSVKPVPAEEPAK